jgi:hypothetical protein
MKTENLMYNITYRGVKGALIGIFSGLILGLLVWGLLLAVDTIFPVESSYSVMPASVITFLGMGFGAIIGGIFGSIACLKERLQRK